MIIMRTQTHRIARRAVRIAMPVHMVLHLPYLRYTKADGTPVYQTTPKRGMIRNWNGSSVFGVSAPYAGYTKNDHRMQCTLLKDRRIRKQRLARVQPYAWPGGYLIVAHTSDGATLCPFCAATNDLDHSDSKIVGRETIDYAADGLEDDEPLYCDGCSKDMQQM